MASIAFSLYLVTDRHRTGGRPLSLALDDALGAGLPAVQLREKDLDTRALLALAGELRSLTARHGAKLLVNDRVDVALAVGADGVHLRSDSLPVSVVRRLLGPDRLIGVSAHSVEEARRAEAEGADFAVLGPVYATPSKQPYGAPIGLKPIEDASRGCRMPILAIGGLTDERVGAVRQAGASGVAVISAILAAPDVAAATRRLLEALEASSR